MDRPSTIARLAMPAVVGKGVEATIRRPWTDGKAGQPNQTTSIFIVEPVR